MLDNVDDVVRGEENAEGGEEDRNDVGDVVEDVVDEEVSDPESGDVDDRACHDAEEVKEQEHNDETLDISQGGGKWSSPSPSRTKSSRSEVDMGEGETKAGSEWIHRHIHAHIRTLT